MSVNESTNDKVEGVGINTEDKVVKVNEERFDVKVLAKLNELFEFEKLSPSDLDERALNALQEFPVDGALAVLCQFSESDLDHVTNKSAYLCGMMKSCRQNYSARGARLKGETVHQHYPDQNRINAILERTGYSLDVTTGQRKYGGPPPGWNGPSPGNGCEIFCGKIPKELYEDALIPHFEKCGRIWELRLMMDPLSGLNRGYAFVKFTSKEEALEAVRQMDSFEIIAGKLLQVKFSVPNTRLFVGNIPKTKSKEEILNEFHGFSDGLVDVIVYSTPDDVKLNRGFCFLEYESHNYASLAKKRFGSRKTKVWGCEIIVDWADPLEEPDEEVMSQVKVLYCRNLPCWVTEENLKETFEKFGGLERVKKIKNYAFVHFDKREKAVEAMNSLNMQELFGSKMEISLAKPPSDKRNKEIILRKREQRMMQMMAETVIFPSYSSNVVAGSRGRASQSGKGYYDQKGHTNNQFWGMESLCQEGWNSQVNYPYYQYSDMKARRGSYDNGFYRGNGNWRGYSVRGNPRFNYEEKRNDFKPRYVKLQ